MWYTSCMDTLYFILLLLGALSFAGAATGVSLTPSAQSRRVTIGLLPLGLLFWVLVPLIEQGRIVF